MPFARPHVHEIPGAIADLFDALTSKGPCKEAWPVDKALDTLRREAGRHFDPAVVDAFGRSLPKVMAICEQYRHIEE